MNSANLSQLVIHTLEENKGLDITLMDVTKLTDIMDSLVICTATSSRHAKSLANKIIVASKEAGMQPLGMEGEGKSEWILIDLGDVVAHIMLADTREFYNLEKLWSVLKGVRNKEA